MPDQTNYTYEVRQEKWDANELKVPPLVLKKVYKLN